MKKHISTLVPVAVLVCCLVWAHYRDSAPAKNDQIQKLKVPSPRPNTYPPPPAAEVALPDAVSQSGRAANPISDQAPGPDTESYKSYADNSFRTPLNAPLSTFSIDVDRASYSNIRRFIDMGQYPPPDAVRVEEMINYFTYEYPQPVDGHPFSINTEVAISPWKDEHLVVQIGLQGKTLPTDNLPPSNLIFLVDVSGSMDEPNKLPLVKQSFSLLIEQLREADHVGIVVYAGAAGVVLEPTSGADKSAIRAAIEQLEAGGSTAGGEGLRLAYRLAGQHFKPEGNNRVIIATDGDFNVGESSDEAMEALIESKRKEGIFLTVLGFGMGNYKDSKLEILADKGNGNYAYIDDLSEARKTLVSEFGGTLFTIAKDVKIQVEFNPARVQAYRLIGYENRVLRDEDFNNDGKDAGELGSGHTVTALYEIIPVGVTSSFFNVDTLKYQANLKPATGNAEELMTVKLRYKLPDGHASKLMVHPVSGPGNPVVNGSENFRWACSVAGFGMLLRNSPYVNGMSFDRVIALAEQSKGTDREGYRSEFITMVKTYGSLSRR